VRRRGVSQTLDLDFTKPDVVGQVAWTPTQPLNDQCSRGPCAPTKTTKREMMKGACLVDLGPSHLWRLHFLPTMMRRPSK